MQFYIVDAFSQAMFGGNPAGVVLTDAPLPERYMRSLAAELRYSETAFVQSGDGACSIRYFTPTEEVALCGHATIAAFTALRHAGLAKPGGSYRADTAAGTLEIDVLSDSVWMDMAAPHSVAKPDPRDIGALYAALGLSAGDMPLALSPKIVSAGLPDFLLAVADRERLNGIVPNFAAISEFSRKYSAVGIHAFALGKDGVTAYCRNFAPAYGIDEEAATGTSNGALTYFLYEHGLVEQGAVNRFVQGEAMLRPSSVLTKLSLRGGVPFVRVGGSGVILAHGELLLQPQT